MNVFEDCGSTKCGAIWYHMMVKTFKRSIIYMILREYKSVSIDIKDKTVKRKI